MNFLKIFMAWFGNRSGDTLQDTPPDHK